MGRLMVITGFGWSCGPPAESGICQEATVVSELTCQRGWQNGVGRGLTFCEIFWERKGACAGAGVTSLIGIRTNTAAPARHQIFDY